MLNLNFIFTSPIVVGLLCILIVAGRIPKKVRYQRRQCRNTNFNRDLCYFAIVESVVERGDWMELYVYERYVGPS